LKLLVCDSMTKCSKCGYDFDMNDLWCLRSGYRATVQCVKDHPHALVCSKCADNYSKSWSSGVESVP